MGEVMYRAREAQQETEQESTKQAILYNASPYPWALATNRLQVPYGLFLWWDVKLTERTGKIGPL